MNPTTQTHLLAQAQEIQQLIEQFQGQKPTGRAVQGPEVLVRTALFKPANALVGWLPSPGLLHRFGRD